MIRLVEIRLVEVCWIHRGLVKISRVRIGSSAQCRAY
jgi:hypothetical protein